MIGSSRWYLACAVIAFLLLLSGAGCSSAPGAPEGSPSKPGGPAGKAVVALLPQNTGTVDPALQGGGSDTPNIEPLYNRLLETPADKSELVAGVAREWAMSADGLTWEFRLRKDVRYHNGDLVIPEDVVYSVGRVSRISLPANKAFVERSIAGMETKGDDGVVFRLKQPDWTFLQSISSMSYSIVPKKYVEKIGDEAFAKAPIGSGPFKFVSGAQQEYLELEAIDYEHFLTQPGAKQLRYAIVAEETTRVAMLRTGEADLAFLSVASLKDIQKDDKVRPIKVPACCGFKLMLFGQGDAQNPLSKLEVRQALNLTIDREAIAKGIYRGYAILSGTSAWNPSQPGFPEWGNKAPYDAEKAKSLLAKAGYPGGKGLKFTLHNYEYGPTPLFTQVAPVMAAEWEKVLGIQVELRQWDFGAYAAQARAGTLPGQPSISLHNGNGFGPRGNLGDYDATGTFGIAAGTLAGGSTMAGGTGTVVAHPELARMMVDFNKELDPAKREVLRDKIMVYDRDNVVYPPMLILDGIWGAGPRLLEYTPPVFGRAGNMYTIKVKP